MNRVNQAEHSEPVLHQGAGLYTDFYELTMAQGYFLSGRAEKPACFDYFFRKIPFKGGYVIFAGLHNLLEILAGLSFRTEEILYLREKGFDDRFLEYLNHFRFKGTIHAAREGEIVFAQEPVIRVSGTVLETQIVETLLLNLINFQSLIATKASRLRMVAGDRTLIDFGLRRAQGLGGIHASRAAIIGGADSTSNVYSAFRFALEVSGTMAHSWVQSFESELEAFRVFSRTFPEHSVLLVDTYDTLNSGVPNAIRVAHEMARSGHRLRGIRLDSGDLAYLSKQARRMLDREGLDYVKIVASSQLDEYIIKSVLEQGAPIDAFGVGTRLVVGKNDAALDGVYKLSMFDNLPKLKLSEELEKVLLPGVKHIFRYYDNQGQFFADAIAREDENDVDEMYHPFQPLKQVRLSGLRKEPLLTLVMKDGRITIPPESPYEIARYARERLALLPAEHKRFENPQEYKVGISNALKELRDSLAHHYKRDKHQVKTDKRI